MKTLYHDIKGLPRLTWVLFVGTLINRFGSFVLLFLILYLKQKGFSIQEAGITAGSYGIGAIVAALLGGYLADHFGRRNTIALSMGCAAVMLSVMSQVDGFVTMMIVTVGTGFAAELYRPAASALLTDITTPEQRVTAFAVHRLAINLGFVAGPAIGGFMAMHSYIYLFIGNAATSLLYGVIAMMFLPSTRASDVAGDDVSSDSVLTGAA